MRTKVNNRSTFLSCASLLAMMPLLASCASSGLYEMSDDWCARHVDASPAHCPVSQNEPVVQSVRNSNESNESNDAQQLDPQRAGLASR
jgi:hypothetical protein